MAINQSEIGHGTTMALAGGWGSAIDMLAINHSGCTRASVPTSHLGIAAPSADSFGNMTFLPAGLSDPGEIVFEFAHNPDILPPIDESEDTLTITFNSNFNTNPKWVGKGHFTAFDVAVPEEKMTGSATFKLSGGQTRTAGGA